MNNSCVEKCHGHSTRVSRKKKLTGNDFSARNPQIRWARSAPATVSVGRSYPTVGACPDIFSHAQPPERSIVGLSTKRSRAGTPLSEPEESTKDDKRPHRTELAAVLRVQTAHRSLHDHDTLLRFQT